MGSKPEANYMPHMVLIPSPFQSHIKTMLKLAKLLHSKGFHITFINTEFNHQRFLKSRGPDALDGLPHFKFETIPDGLPHSNIDASRESIPLAMAVVMRAAEASVKTHAIAIHTFDALEQDVLDGLSTIFPRVYSIGPLQLLLNQIQQDGLSSVGYNLWKEDSECLQWLDTKEPKSVVYVNFGSIAVMTAEQLVEFAMGLANSEISFLWIIRPDLVTGESAILPAEFQVDTQNRGFVTSWCPQEEVLNHPSVGGFLTHTGWNSIIESLCAGVPVICWPLFADQPINCSYACIEWGVGMEIDNNVRREEVEKLIRNLMGGEECKKMREKAKHWRKVAEEATVPNGSSSINLDKFINEMLQPNITL